jgi:hypothetical protein
MSASLDDQLRDHPDELVSLLRQLLELVEACGPFDLERTRVGFAFHGKRRIFGSAKLGRSGVRGHLVLPKAIRDDPRFTKIEPPTKKLYFHGFLIRDADDLDASSGRYVHTAYRVGQGETDPR